MINGCNVDNVEEWNDDRVISDFSLSTIEIIAERKALVVSSCLAV